MRLYSALAAGAAAADDDDGSLMGSNEKAPFLFVFRFMTLTTPRAAIVHYNRMSILLFEIYFLEYGIYVCVTVLLTIASLTVIRVSIFPRTH